MADRSDTAKWNQPQRGVATPDIAIGVYRPTIHKHRTHPREVVLVIDDGCIIWRREGRCDLAERSCGPRAWEMWVKKFRAKVSAE